MSVYISVEIAAEIDRRRFHSPEGLANLTKMPGLTDDDTYLICVGCWYCSAAEDVDFVLCPDAYNPFRPGTPHDEMLPAPQEDGRSVKARARRERRARASG